MPEMTGSGSTGGAQPDKYGYFAGGGDRYVITTPRTPARWFNYLFNDSYYMEVSQTGQGSSTAFQPKQRQITRDFRYFYVKDEADGSVWCPGYQPLRTPAEDYACTHGMYFTEIRSRQSGIEAVVHVFVPAEGQREVWSLTLKNRGTTERRLSLFSVFSLENGGVMGSSCRCDAETGMVYSFSFPYHVAYEEQEQNRDHTNVVYVYPGDLPDSWDGSQRRFFGGEDGHAMPAAVEAGRCGNVGAEAEDPVGALHHRLIIGPGGERTLRFVVGCAGSAGEAAVASRGLAGESWSEELERTEAYWAELTDTFRIDTPDVNVNAFVNHWLKKQIVFQTRTNRMSNYCPVRNQLQDALGYAMIDPAGAADYMLSVLRGQRRDGSVKQWIMTDGSPPKALCRLNHTDGPVWLLICFTALVNQSGGTELLNRKAGFTDSADTATVYEHLLLAAEYMAGATGDHGLCLMGDGDWNDPINGPGRLGRGESAWNTMALVYGLRSFVPLCRMMGDPDQADRLTDMAARLHAAVNDTCWDGEWYVAGFDDSGVPFGTAADEEGKLFLNAQTWAVMSGIAGGERLRLCLKAIDSLDTPFRPLLLTPAFSQWNAKWGRVSVKLAGTTENGSAYCHAAMFKAFADCMAGRGSVAWETVARTLPTNPDNPPERNLQVPIFVPNYYFGLADSPNYGHSSHHHSTGTVGWMLWTVLEYALGMRATAAGLVIDPCIPADWAGFKAERAFGGARYRLEVLNPERTGKGVAEITVDGEVWTEACLPCEAGGTYEVKVILG